MSSASELEAVFFALSELMEYCWTLSLLWDDVSSAHWERGKVGRDKEQPSVFHTSPPLPVLPFPPETLRRVLSALRDFLSP